MAYSSGWRRWVSSAKMAELCKLSADWIASCDDVRYLPYNHEKTIHSLRLAHSISCLCSRYRCADAGERHTPRTRGPSCRHPQTRLELFRLRRTQLHICAKRPEA